MRQYPYVGKGKRGSIVLFSGDSVGFAIEHANKAIEGERSGGWDEGVFTNVTHEYLSNTWGVVESKEHAEFIIELAELHGFSVYRDLYPIRKDIFSVNKHGMLFFHEDNGLALSKELKQITIPLPPKASYNIEVKNNTELNVDITRDKDVVNIMIDKETPKVELPEAGHNLVFAGGECKEWPCVNDDVVTRGGSKGVLVVSKPDNDGMVLCDFDGEYALVYLNELQKPKTPEEDLRDDIKQEVFSSFAIFPELLDKRDTVISISECVSNELIRKYNITPKEV